MHLEILPVTLVSSVFGDKILLLVSVVELEGLFCNFDKVSFKRLMCKPI